MFYVYELSVLSLKRPTRDIAHYAIDWRLKCRVLTAVAYCRVDGVFDGNVVALYCIITTALDRAGNVKSTACVSGI